MGAKKATHHIAMLFEDAKVDYSMGALKFKHRKRRRKTTRRGKTEMEHFFRGVHPVANEGKW